MGEDQKYQVIFADKTQEEAINSFLKGLDAKVDRSMERIFRACEEYNEETREQIKDKDKRLKDWCDKKDAEEKESNKRYEAYKKRVDAAQARHMKVVEKFLALIAKRIK